MSDNSERAKKAEEEAFQRFDNHLNKIREHNDNVADAFAQIFEKSDKLING